MARRKVAGRPIAVGRRLSKSTPATKAGTPFPYLEDLVLRGGGDISIGEIGPVTCAAVASDEHNMLAALQRRKGEDLMQLLTRLEAALARAIDDGEYTDEING